MSDLKQKVFEIVDNLRADCVENKPIDIDWVDLGHEAFESYHHETCECREDLVSYAGDQLECEECGASVYFSELVMNYFYPLPGKFDSESALKLSGPLALVYLSSSDQWGLVLTGGGMDLSWEICAAYIELGFLPPVHFDLPGMAGMKLTLQTAVTLEACEKSLRIVAGWTESRLERLADLNQTITDRK